MPKGGWGGLKRKGVLNVGFYGSQNLQVSVTQMLVGGGGEGDFVGGWSCNANRTNRGLSWRSLLVTSVLLLVAFMTVEVPNLFLVETSLNSLGKADASKPRSRVIFVLLLW